MGSKIDKFCSLFKEIEFSVKVKKERPQPSQEQLELQKTEKILVELNKALARAKVEFNAAKKMHKQGKLSANDLFEFEVRMSELKDEINRIKNNNLDKDLLDELE